MNQQGYTGEGSQPGEKAGHGKGYFVIGPGPDYFRGDVEVRLRTASPPGNVSVEWIVDNDRITDDVKQEILSTASDDLLWYVGTYPEYGLSMTFEKVTAGDIRRHNFTRATVLALYDALSDASLPWPEFKGD